MDDQSRDDMSTTWTEEPLIVVRPKEMLYRHWGGKLIAEAEMEDYLKRSGRHRSSERLIVIWSKGTSRQRMSDVVERYQDMGVSNIVISTASEDWMPRHRKED